jgi:uncharacterized membrane protein
MVDQLLLALTLLAALGCGLVAGVFFAFSSFVMKALAQLPTPQGIAAMQSINAVVLNRWFLGVFVGTAAACLLAVICAFLRWHTGNAVILLVGGALYLIGSFAVTALFNVPKNDVLAKLAPSAPASANGWAEYVASWTKWNHVRTVAALAAAASFSLALRV